MTQCHFMGWDFFFNYLCFCAQQHLCFFLFIQLFFRSFRFLFFCPRVQLMGCRKDRAQEPTVWIMCLVTEIPNYIPTVFLSPANYQVNIPIRPGRHIRRIRQLFLVPLILMLNEMLNSNLEHTLININVNMQAHIDASLSTYLVLAWLSHQPVYSLYITLTN